jgi:hypothetical protein
LSRLANKLAVNYKETRERNTREEVPRDDELPELIEVKDNSDDDSDDTVVDVDPRDIPTIEKQLEMSNKLFQMLEDQETKFPECLKGRYTEDPWFKEIIEFPGYFANFETRDDLIYYRSEEAVKLAIPDVKINGHSAWELVIQ